MIKAAFKKTVVWPWNPNVVTEQMMAPSFETSLEGKLPLPQPSPVHAISLAMSQYRKFTTDDTNGVNTIVTGPSNCPTWHSIAKDTVESLAFTSALFLVKEGPLTSSDQLLEYIIPPQTPTHKHEHALLKDEPENEKEQAYQGALQEAYAHETQYKSTLVGMQSTMVLQAMFCKQLSGQLATQEEKQKKKRKGQLNGDGLLRLLTNNKFYNQVVQHKNAYEEEEVVQESRRKQHEEQAALMEEEQVRVKVEKHQVQWSRPKQGKLEPQVPKPAVAGEDADGDGGKNNDEVDEEVVLDSGSVADNID
ncbi:hypothetical protein EV363DRAFT_1299941 [Boletus edulis]|nr:hypothetical protein EV363DRAFT_1299941 [Boletus edulis]